MKPVLYTLTESGVLVPAAEAVTQADVQQAYDVGYGFGEVAGQRYMLEQMQRIVEARQGPYEIQAEDLETARRRMLH